MNPYLWELWHVGDNPGAFTPSTPLRCLKREVTQVQLDWAMGKLTPQQRFVNHDLLLNAVENIHFPIGGIEYVEPKKFDPLDAWTEEEFERYADDQYSEAWN